MEKKTGDIMNAVITTLVILITAVVIGTGVVLYGTSLFNASTNLLKSENQNENQDTIKQSDGTIINKTQAEEMVKNMIEKRLENGKINQTDFWLQNGFGNNEFPIFYIQPNNLVLSDNTHKVKVSDDPFNDTYPAKIKVPNYLIHSMNNTINKIMIDWKNSPFIKNYEDADIPRITNTTVMTVKGYVVLDDSGNKVITLGTGNMILTDHVFTFGEYVTLNKVVHDQMCAINYVTLSNGTEISGNLASQVYNNPEKFGLMSKENANSKWGDWANSAFYAHGYGCDKHEFVTWELVH